MARSTTVRLRRVRPYASPGFTRIDDRFVSDGSGRVTAADRARAAELVIPPAWTEVWVSSASNGHIQAVGVDDAGRRQYIYHPAWRQRQDRDKFRRALDLAEALPRARALVTTDLRRVELSRERVLAATFRILDTVAVRVGNDQYATTNGSRGLSTLQQRHVKVDDDDRVHLRFPAKSGKRAQVAVQDADLARTLRALVGGPAARRLFVVGEGRHPLSASEVNDYVRMRTGGDFSAKDFRTLRGTLIAAQHLATLAPSTTERERRRVIRSTAVVVAEGLGNTPAVALSSYIDPEVFTRFESGEVLDLRLAPEQALLRLLR